MNEFLLRNVMVVMFLQFVMLWVHVWIVDLVVLCVNHGAVMWCESVYGKKKQFCRACWIKGCFTHMLRLSESKGVATHGTNSEMHHNCKKHYLPRKFLNWNATQKCILCYWPLTSHFSRICKIFTVYLKYRLVNPEQTKYYISLYNHILLNSC